MRGIPSQINQKLGVSLLKNLTFTIQARSSVQRLNAVLELNTRLAGQVLCAEIKCCTRA